MNKKSTRTDIPQVDIQKVNQVISDDYDSLNATNAARAIRGLELDELLVATLHEYQSKQRRSVIRVALSKLFNTPQALALKEQYQREAQEGFTILQVGETGVGKSSTINSLFGEEVAKTNRFETETRSVTPFEGTHHNVKYTIYDTPGLGEWSTGDLNEKYLSLMKEQCPLPDVLWFVLRIDLHITRADRTHLQLIHKNFGDAIWDRTMIVFTHSDRLTASKEFQEYFDRKTNIVNQGIAEITNGKVQKVPTVAVANGHKRTPDGNSWLGELFTTSFERLNPERQNAFLLAFAMDLEIPKPQPPKSKAQKPKANSREEATEDTRREEKRIELTEGQVERVKEKSVGTSSVLAGALLGVQVGAAIEAVMAGTGLGIPTIIGAFIGGVAGFFDWLWRK